MVALQTENDTLQGTLARKDLAKLQGTWHYAAGTRVADLVVSDDGFTIRFKNGDVYAGTFRLDPTHRPKAIDLTIADGPDRHMGKESLGLYVLDGHRLELCPGVPGSGERLAALPGPDDRETLWIVFEREKSA